MPLKRCKSCGARVVWVTMRKTRRPMPLDPEPTTGGTIELVKLDGRDFGNVVPAAERGERPLYVSHFATCPNARQHRKGGAA